METVFFDGKEYNIEEAKKIVQLVNKTTGPLNEILRWGQSSLAEFISMIDSAQTTIQCLSIIANETFTENIEALGKINPIFSDPKMESIVINARKYKSAEYSHQLSTYTIALVSILKVALRDWTTLLRKITPKTSQNQDTSGDGRFYDSFRTALYKFKIDLPHDDKMKEHIDELYVVRGCLVHAGRIDEQFKKSKIAIASDYNIGDKLTVSNDRFNDYINASIALIRKMIGLSIDNVAGELSGVYKITHDL